MFIRVCSHLNVTPSKGVHFLIEVKQAAHGGSSAIGRPRGARSIRRNRFCTLHACWWPESDHIVTIRCTFHGCTCWIVNTDFCRFLFDVSFPALHIRERIHLRGGSCVRGSCTARLCIMGLAQHFEIYVGFAGDRQPGWRNIRHLPAETFS